MKTLRARVVKGRYVIDEPSTLPEGTLVELVIAGDQAVDISGEEHAELRAVIEQSDAEFQAGQGHSVADLARSRKVARNSRRR